MCGIIPTSEAGGSVSRATYICITQYCVYMYTPLNDSIEEVFTALCLKSLELIIYYMYNVYVHSMLQVIRLALERLQIFEDKTLYELYEGRSGENEAVWKLLNEEEYPIIRQENWSAKDTRHLT